MIRLGRIHPEQDGRSIRGATVPLPADTGNRPRKVIARHLAGRLAAAVLIAATGVLGAGAARGSAAGGSGAAQPDAAGTVWLCRPGMANNPCTTPLDATVIQATGAPSVRHITPAVNSKFDCFFLYPTVSAETTDNSDLTVQPVEIAAAEALAAPFSQVCRIWAPMYRQQTGQALLNGHINDSQSIATAFDSVLAGWRDYLKNYNAGRPIVFVGHSQGSAMLIRLLQSQVDYNPALRKKLVSAIIPGGNVIVATAPGAWGSFQHLPACLSAHQVGCIIAYSTFPDQPPVDTLFGRPGKGLNVQPGQATTGVQVLCTNPAALGGGTAALDTYVPTSAITSSATLATPWLELPDLYSATCMSEGGATWLNVTATTPADPRPHVAESYAKSKAPMWGFHGLDIPLAVGNLVLDVSQQEAAYEAAFH
jgi:hypothetical protein